MSSLYLEQYLESVESLPSDLRRNFSLMRELDVQTHDDCKKLDADCQAFLEELGKMTSEERKARVKAIQEGFKHAVDLSDQKVALAVQTYETVDKHIRQLDNDLRRFEEDTDDYGRGDSSAKKRGRPSKTTETEHAEDMPVDPNEPTYCLCHQVSYGEMIGCDNPDCQTEWFHFACVNLTEKPKGKWYCPRCQAEMTRLKKLKRK